MSFPRKSMRSTAALDRRGVFRYRNTALNDLEGEALSVTCKGGVFKIVETWSTLFAKVLATLDFNLKHLVC